MHYWGGDGRCAFLERHKDIFEASPGEDNDFIERYRYDALGRRVLVHALRGKWDKIKRKAREIGVSILIELGGGMSDADRKIKDNKAKEEVGRRGKAKENAGRHLIPPVHHQITVVRETISVRRCQLQAYNPSSAWFAG